VESLFQHLSVEGDLGKGSFWERIYGNVLALPPGHPLSRLQRTVRAVTSGCTVPPDQRQRGILFIHVPKTGGQSVEKALSLAERGHVPISYFLIHHQRTLRDLFTFAFVRNPYDRLISAFHYLKRGGGNPSDERWAGRMLAGLETCEEFLDALTHPSFRAAILSGVHFRPQSDFLYGPDGRLAVHFIGRFERIAQDYAVLANRLHGAPTLPHANRSDRNDSLAKLFSTNASRQAVVAMYKADFLAFGYDPRWLQQSLDHHKTI
jgi:chondroitin 4-sulfotransferase 11